MKMAGNDINKHARTSKEQIDCYLAFVESHPQMKLHKNDPTNPRRMEELWAELSEQLNALKGPVRTPIKWKESLTHWKNQVRSRARKSKANRLATGGGPLTEVDVSQREQRALDTIGSNVVFGAQDIPTIGAETDELIILDPVSPSVQESVAFRPLIQELDPFEMSFQESETSAQAPTTSRNRKPTLTSQEMFGKMLTTIQERNEEERKYRADSLKCMEQFSTSLNNMASAVLALAQSRGNQD